MNMRRILLIYLGCFLLVGSVIGLVGGPDNPSVEVVSESDTDDVIRNVWPLQEQDRVGRIEVHIAFTTPASVASNIQFVRVLDEGGETVDFESPPNAQEFARVSLPLDQRLTVQIKGYDEEVVASIVVETET